MDSLRREILEYVGCATAGATLIRRVSLLPQLTERIRGLNSDELAVLEDVIESCLSGLEKGRAAYGSLDLSNDMRDFTAEANDEMRDGNLYIAMDRVRRSR